MLAGVFLFRSCYSWWCLKACITRMEEFIHQDLGKYISNPADATYLSLSHTHHAYFCRIERLSLLSTRVFLSSVLLSAVKCLLFWQRIERWTTTSITHQRQGALPSPRDLNDSSLIISAPASVSASITAHVLRLTITFLNGGRSFPPTAKSIHPSCV